MGRAVGGGTPEAGSEKDGCLKEQAADPTGSGGLGTSSPFLRVSCFHRPSHLRWLVALLMLMFLPRSW